MFSFQRMLSHEHPPNFPEETVEVSVLRDNSETKLFIPRGPMGIRLESFRSDPVGG